MYTRRIAATALLAVTVALLLAIDTWSASITIAGNGPELRTIEELARAFEKRHLGSYVQIRWELSSQPLELVKSGAADVAVTGRSDPDLMEVPIAWDGIAVVVDFTNPVKAVMRQDVAAIFTGAVTRWSQLGGPDIEIHPIEHPPNQHIRKSFEELLGLVSHASKSARVIPSDQRSISTVAGDCQRLPMPHSESFWMRSCMGWVLIC